MGWLRNLILLAATAGLWWGYQVMHENGPITDNTIATPELVKAILVFLASVLVWAIYLAVVITPWIGRRFVEILYNSGGSLPLKRESSLKQEKEEDSK